MVWPFLTLYLRQRLTVPLTGITALLTVNAVAGLVTTTIAGLVVDRFGRKGAMVIGLLGFGLVMLGMIPAASLAAWAALMAFNGGIRPNLSGGRGCDGRRSDRARPAGLRLCPAAHDR